MHRSFASSRTLSTLQLHGDIPRHEEKFTKTGKFQVSPEQYRGRICETSSNASAKKPMPSSLRHHNPIATTNRRRARVLTTSCSVRASTHYNEIAVKSHDLGVPISDLHGARQAESSGNAGAVIETAFI